MQTLWQWRLSLKGLCTSWPEGMDKGRDPVRCMSSPELRITLDTCVGGDFCMFGFFS
jgi:hypothetical protein